MSPTTPPLHIQTSYPFSSMTKENNVSTSPAPRRSAPQTPRNLELQNTSAPSSALSEQLRIWDDAYDESLSDDSSIEDSDNLEDIIESLDIKEHGRSKNVVLGEVIGRGAHATIRIAHRDRHTYAAKVANNAGSTVYIKRERQVLRHISSALPKAQGIISAYECCEREMLLLDLADCNLFEYVQRSPLGRLESAQWAMHARSIVHALCSLQDIGIVHCDIKPQNVLMVRGETVLADFESAYTIDDRIPPVEKKGYDVVGSNVYTAPEILRGRSSPTFSSDVYAMGIVLLVMATGEEPYTQSRNVIEQILQAQRGDPIRFSRRSDVLLPYHERIIRAACDKNIELRWSAKKCLAELS